jgi:hypothetical protein
MARHFNFHNRIRGTSIAVQKNRQPNIPLNPDRDVQLCLDCLTKKTPSEILSVKEKLVSHCVHHQEGKNQLGDLSTGWSCIHFPSHISPVHLSINHTTAFGTSTSSHDSQD